MPSRTPPTVRPSRAHPCFTVSPWWPSRQQSVACVYRIWKCAAMVRRLRPDARGAPAGRHCTVGSLFHHRHRCVCRCRHVARLPAHPAAREFRRRLEPGAPRAAELIPPPIPVKPDHNPTAPAVYSVEADTPDVSSTEIRRRVGAGDSLDGLVPLSVAGHIRRHHLYVPAPVPAVL